ncbi:unnamed protein product [Paramecium primaurelia]|uniref:Uncharacterized protein n=1 Tax=Paramecium primaurelia TaxID=5886 RepID=A0A8S1Q609_PARPR|nr:unnamed protein product [Paramecium primaurelia]
MNQIYHDSLLQALKTQILVPITLDCRYLKEALSEISNEQQFLQIEDYFLNQDLIDGVNKRSIKLMIECIKILRKYMFIGWNVSPKFIEDIVYEFIDRSVEEWKEPVFFVQRLPEIKVQIKGYYKTFQENAFELCDTLISELCDDYLNSAQLNILLNEILESQLKRVAYDLFEFAYLDTQLTTEFLDNLQKLFIDLVTDFSNYLIDVACHANYKMQQLDKLLKIYGSLANQENYKYMQKEVSQNIIDYGDITLVGQSFQVNQEKHSVIVKQTIKHFYYVMDECKQLFTAKWHKNFDELINNAQFNLIKPLPQNIQVIQDQDDILLMEQCHDIKVIKSQKVQKNDLKGLKILVKDDKNNKVQQFILSLSYHYLMFHKFEQGWEAFDDEKEQNILLAKFLNEQFDYLHCGHPEFKKRVASEKSIDRTADDISGFKNAVFKFKKISAPKKPIRYGTSNRVIGGKALGMGIGVLIVDCLDEDIPWDDKLKNAGFTAISFGVLGLLASRLPIVGIIIQQVILALAVKSILANKVINDSQTAKNLGHLGLIITIGVGMTIAGSILFPVAFWGAFFGGLLGGVGMGLYQKFLIPYYMDNIVEMMNKASKLIRKNGVVRYKPYALQKLQIDDKFLSTHKPSKMHDDQYFTLLMFCLSNEIRLISTASYAKQLEKLKSKNAKEQEKADLLQRQCQIEVSLKVWNDTYDYLKSNNVSLVDNAKSCAEFVDGMLTNYKVE